MHEKSPIKNEALTIVAGGELAYAIARLGSNTEPDVIHITSAVVAIAASAAAIYLLNKDTPVDPDDMGDIE